MMGTHARTLAMQSLGIPAGWGTYLMLPMDLDHIDLFEPAYQTLHRVLKPSSGHLPSFELRAPLGFVSVGISKPSIVIQGVGNLDKKRKLFPFHDNRDLILTPYINDSRVIF